MLQSYGDNLLCDLLPGNCNVPLDTGFGGLVVISGILLAIVFVFRDARIDVFQCNSYHCNEEGSSSGNGKIQRYKQDSIRIGKQTVEKGCANLYGSDPNKEWTDDRPGSPTFGQKVPVPSFTVCGDTKVDGDELMALGFDRKGVEQPDMVGVTFVETGEDCWLTLYDNSNFDGDSTIIAPMTAAPLVKVGEHAWDDVTRSLTSSVKPHIADGTAIAFSCQVGLLLEI